MYRDICHLIISRSSITLICLAMLPQILPTTAETLDYPRDQITRAEQVGKVMLGLSVVVEPNIVGAYDPLKITLIYTNRLPTLSEQKFDGAFQFGRTRSGVSVAIFDSHGSRVVLDSIYESGALSTGCTIPRGGTKTGRITLPHTLTPKKQGKYSIVVTYQSGVLMERIGYVPDLMVHSSPASFEVRDTKGAAGDVARKLSIWETLSEEQRSEVLNGALKVGDAGLINRAIDAAKGEPALVMRVLQIVCDKQRPEEIRQHAADSLTRINVADVQCLFELIRSEMEGKKLRLEGIRLLSSENQLVPRAKRIEMLDTLFQHFSKTKEVVYRLAVFDGIVRASGYSQDQLAEFALSDADVNLRALALNSLVKMGAKRNSLDRAAKAARRVSSDNTPLDPNVLGGYLNVQKQATLGSFARKSIEVIEVLKLERQQDSPNGSDVAPNAGQGD